MSESQRRGRSRRASKTRNDTVTNEEGSAAALPDGPLAWLVLYVVFASIALFAYGPSLNGAFLSDDMHYVAENDYVHDMGFASVIAILDPAGDPAKLVENYAPVHLLMYGIEWQLFGRNVFGYHVVNVLMHALASLLLVAFFRRFGISQIAAVIAGGLFLVHPANVEAVAWIAQLKTPTALALTLAALLVQAKRPGLGTVLFALALFAKPTAAVGLFALGLMTLFDVGRPNREPEDRRPAGLEWRWVVVWGVVFVIFAVVEFGAFGRTAGQAPVLYTDPIARFRSTCAISMRYVVMAATGRGLSTFHEPEAAGPFDPWWLASIVMLGLLGWRLAITLLARRAEGIFWVWAAVSFAPISGLIPLPFPMADRYLYFIMPGLMGGVMFAGPAIAKPLVGDRIPRPITPEIVRTAVIIAVLSLAYHFVNVTHARSYVWLNAASMMADAELHYPQGMPAQTRIAHRRAMQGDAEGTVAALRAANARGYNRLDHLISDPGYDLIRDTDVFQEFVREVAQSWYDRFIAIESPSEVELRLIAQARVVLGDLPGAIEAIEQAISLHGPIESDLREDLEKLKRAQRIRESVEKPTS